MYRNKGIIFVIISAMIFGCTPLFAKNIYFFGGNSVNLAFNRFVFALPVLFSLMKKHSLDIHIDKKEAFKIFILSIGFAGTPILLFSSYNYISSGLSTTIHFVYPIVVILVSIIIFNEKVKLMKILCIILCSIGIILLHTPNSEGNIIGFILAFTSGITYAFYIIYLDGSGLKELQTYKLTFYLTTVCAIELLFFSLITNSFTVNIKPVGWILTICFSLTISIVASVLFQVGIKLVGPQQASMLSTFEPITSIMVGVLFFNENFNLKKLGGVILILISVIFLTVFDNQRCAEGEK